MTNTLGIMLEILSNYPGSKLSVRIIRVIKRQFFYMVTHVFDNSNLLQEIFAINTRRAVICSLGHGRKHMLTIRHLQRAGSCEVQREMHQRQRTANLTTFLKAGRSKNKK